MAPKLRTPPRRRILGVVLIALLGHLTEIALFAAIFWGLGAAGIARTSGLDGAIPFKQAAYFSLESYASLGSIDFPDGPLRIFAGVEALTGLLLIGWTASYTYLAMREFWGDH